MNDGFIKLHRKIRDHWLWKDKPFSKGQAWTDLMMMANHTEGKFLLGNELIEAEIGQVITSEVKLSENWGWSRTKTRDFLNLLERDKMLLKKSDSKKTVLTLCNYKEYNGLPNSKKTSKEQQKNSAGTAQEQQKDTIKNDKNVKNYKNDKNNPPTPLEKAISDFIEFRTSIKKPMTEKGVQLLYKNLEKLAANDEQMKIAILEQSILRGWTGVFALKEDGNGKAVGSVADTDEKSGTTWGGYSLSIKKL